MHDLQARTLLVVVALSLVSGLGDARGFVHAARIWIAMSTSDAWTIFGTVLPSKLELSVTMCAMAVAAISPSAVGLTIFVVAIALVAVTATTISDRQTLVGASR